MSDRRAYSPSGRTGAMSSSLGADLSDDEYSSRSHGREKFRKERSVERDHAAYMRSSDDYNHADRKKRLRRSITPPDERRYPKRRVSPSRMQSPPRGGYGSRGRFSRGHDRDPRDTDYGQDGDHYIPNYDRDGYEPAPRYSSLNESLNSSSSFGYGSQDMMNMQMAGGGGWPPIGRFPQVDPEQLDYVVSFKQFCEYLRSTHSHSHFDEDELQRRYAAYKEKIQAKQLAQFFNNNKDKQWFLEKYHPVISQSRIDNMKTRRRQLLNQFLTDLQEAKYDGVQFDESSKAEAGNEDVEMKEDGEAENEGPSKDAENNELSQPQQDGSQEYENHLVIKTVPPTIPRQKIIEMCNKVQGFRYVVLSEPSPNRKFHRIGWICFEEGTDMQKAFEELDSQKVDDFTFHIAMNHKNQNQGRVPKIAPESTNTPERLRKDLEKAIDLARVLEAELGDDVNVVDTVIERAKTVAEKFKQDQPEKESESNTESTSKTATVKKELDMIIAYLRNVHMFCYYCCLECDSLEELKRRCPDPHKRRLPGSTTETSDGKQHASQPEKHALQWLKNFDQKLDMRIRKPSGRDLEKLGGKTLKKEMDTYIKEHVLKEHEAKYKCQVGDCSKAFKGFEFVEKHILTKHKEETDKVKQEVEYFNRYVCDPNHLMPMTSGAMHNSMVKVAGNGGMFMSSFAMPNMNSGLRTPHGMPPMQAAAVGTPWDRIPRIGFGDSAPWPALARQPMTGGRNQGINDRAGIRARGGGSMGFDDPLPQDPRQVKSYVDLDAPAEGDANISFY